MSSNPLTVDARNVGTVSDDCGVRRSMRFPKYYYCFCARVCWFVRLVGPSLCMLVSTHSFTAGNSL